MTGAAGGSAGADFDAFVLARGPALWRTAYLLVGDRHRAEDLVQTALAQAWPHFGRVDSFEAYVRRCLVTTASSWWRRKWRGEVSVVDAGSDVVESDVVPDPDLLAALAALPRAQRAVIVLRYYEGLTERETAAALGISVGTVKSHGSRAVAALRRSPLLRSDDVEHPEETR